MLPNGNGPCAKKEGEGIEPTVLIGIALLAVGFGQLLGAVRSARRSGGQRSMYFAIFFIVAGCYFLLSL